MAKLVHMQKSKTHINYPHPPLSFCVCVSLAHLDVDGWSFGIWAICL